MRHSSIIREEWEVGKMTFYTNLRLPWVVEGLNLFCVIQSVVNPRCDEEFKVLSIRYGMEIAKQDYFRTWAEAIEAMNFLLESQQRGITGSLDG